MVTLYWYKYADIEDKTVGGAGLPGPCAVAEENIKKTENSELQDKMVRVSGLPDACAVAEENTEKTENSEYIENLKKTVAESMSVNFQNKFIININFFSLILFKKRVKI